MLAYESPAGAQRAAVEAWVNTMDIAFTKTYTLINTKTVPGCGPELLHSCLLGILGLVNNLADQQSGQLAETLAGCCRVLLSKLQELASSSLSLGLPGDPLSQVCIADSSAAIEPQTRQHLQHMKSCQGTECIIYHEVLWLGGRA